MNEDFDLTTPGGMRDAVKSLTRNLAELTDAAKNGGNVDALKSGLQENRQALAELRAEIKRGEIDRAASGPDSNVVRYFVPADQVSRSAKGGTLLDSKDDQKLVLRGFNDPDRGYVPGLLDDAASFEQQREVQRAFDNYALVREMMSVERNGRKQYRECPKSRAEVLRAIRTLPREAREPIERAFVDSAGTGAEWIETQQLTTLDREEFRISDYEAQFGELTINSKTAAMPYQGLGAVPYIKGRATGDNPPNYKTSDPETNEFTLTTTALAAHVQVDEDAAEDAYLVVLPLVRADLGAGLSDGVADAGINGSTDASHPDTLPGWTAEGRWPSGITGLTDDHRRMMMGLRHRARGISGASFDMGSKANFAGLLEMRGMLDRPYKTRREDLVLFANDDFYIKTLLNLDEVKTIEKYGNGATVLTGELARVQGIPIIPVGFLTGDLNSSGVYAGSGNSKCGLLMVARSQVKRVKRRDLRVEVTREIRNGMYSIVGTVRRGMYYMGGSSRKSVIYGYNLPT